MSQGGVTPLDYNPHAAQQGGVTPTVYPGSGPAVNDPGGGAYEGWRDESYGPFVFYTTDDTTPYVIFDKLFQIPRRTSLFEYIAIATDLTGSGWVSVYNHMFQLVTWQTDFWQTASLGYGSDMMQASVIGGNFQNPIPSIDDEGFVSLTHVGGVPDQPYITGFQIVDPGHGYSNNDAIQLGGTTAQTQPSAFVTEVDAQGGVTRCFWTPGYAVTHIPDTLTTQPMDGRPAPTGTGFVARTTGFAPLKIKWTYWVRRVLRG